MPNRTLHLLAALALTPPSLQGCRRESANPAPTTTPSPAPPATATATATAPSALHANPATAANLAPSGGARPARGPCVATLAQSFHLRPSATAASTGPELPANTEVVALEPAAGVRRRGTVLMHVRVRAGGAGGYAFVAPGEMGASCPVVWASAPGDAGSAASTDAGRAAPRVFPTRAAAVASLAGDELDSVPRGARESTLARVDLDGDGTEDEFVKFDLGGDRVSAVYVAMLHPAAGFMPVTVGMDFIEEHASFAEGSSVVEQLLTATGGPFIVVRSSETPVDGSDAVEDRQSYGLMRCRTGAGCDDVFAANTLFGTAEEWTFAAAPDGSVTVRNDRGRTQTLRWDPAASKLVPE